MAARTVTNRWYLPVAASLIGWLIVTFTFFNYELLVYMLPNPVLTLVGFNTIPYLYGSAVLPGKWGKLKTIIPLVVVLIIIAAALLDLYFYVPRPVSSPVHKARLPVWVQKALRRIPDSPDFIEAANRE